MELIDRQLYHKKSGVYLIKNTIDARVYIGCASDLYKRCSRHREDLIKNQHHSKTMQEVKNKYGFNCLSFHIIKLCDKTNLESEEKYYLDIYQSYIPNKGFNTFIHGNNPKGTKQSAETIKKRADKQIGRPLSEEHKQKLRDIKKGFIMPRYIIEASANKRRGNPLPLSTRQKQSESLKKFYSEKNNIKL